MYIWDGLRMIKTFKYTKENGNVSNRTVYPLGIVEDKLFCVDLSEFSVEEQQDYEVILDALHKNYIEAVKEVGLGSAFRLFFTEGISK